MMVQVIQNVRTVWYSMDGAPWGILWKDGTNPQEAFSLTLNTGGSGCIGNDGTTTYFDLTTGTNNGTPTAFLGVLTGGVVTSILEFYDRGAYSAGVLDQH